jgi:class 3 adenylate cyclase/tetratricopeptide (TPR) repeat protein
MDAPSLVSAPQETSAPHRLQGERRQLTVMFCDLVGSTLLADQLDPEDLQNVLSAYQNASAQAIRTYEGHIAKYLGDGLVIFFGYPQAHEDDPERAIRAGLGILQAMEPVNRALQARYNTQLAVRIGIHTGLVVTGETGTDRNRAMDIVGKTPNIAARLQDVAAPNTIVVSNETRRLVLMRFDFQPLGAHTLRGIAEPIDVYQVKGLLEAETAVHDTSEAERPLVGRASELQTLSDLWKKAVNGEGQIVLLSGDAGIGKSRLKQALRAHVAASGPHFLIEGRCSPYHENSPYYPLIHMFEHQLLRFVREDTPEIKRNKIERFLLERGYALAETAPLLTSLLSVPLGTEYPSLDLSSEGARNKTLNLMLDMVFRRAQKQPFLFVIENIHWADPSTMEYLRQLAECVPGASILLLLTHRPMIASPLPENTHTTEIFLDRLENAAARELVLNLAGDSRLSPQVIEQILQKTDGVPLFVEELTHMVIETAVVSQENASELKLTPELAIPTTLNDSLMSRLDRLSMIKEVAQVAAVIGRECSEFFLAEVMGIDRETLRFELSRLVTAEIFTEYRDTDGTDIYRFKHALLQDAAYKSLLNSRRQQVHRSIVQVFQAHFPEIVENQPELVAGHYAAAALPAEAIEFWIRAGKRALARSANQEAIIHFSRALDLVAGLPPSVEKVQAELSIQVLLGSAYCAVHGFAAPEVGEAFARADALAEPFGMAPPLAPVFRGLSQFYIVRAEFAKANVLAERLLEIGKGDPEIRLAGLTLQGTMNFWMADLHTAKQQLEEVLALYTPEIGRAQTIMYGQDPSIVALLYLALNAMHLGHFDEAHRRCREALALAHRLQHPFSIAWAQVFPAAVAVFCNDWVAAQRLSEEAIAYSSEQGYPFWLAHGYLDLGWALCKQGRHEEGLTHMRQAQALYHATGSVIVYPHFLHCLAEQLGEAGHVEEGLETAALAMTEAQRIREVVTELALYQVQGELLLKTPRPDLDEVENLFRTGRDRCRLIDDRGLEIRMTESLSALLIHRQKPEEARLLLEETLGGLTEGFDMFYVKRATETFHRLKG